MKSFSTLYILMLIKQMKKSQVYGVFVTNPPQGDQGGYLRFLGDRLGEHLLTLNAKTETPTWDWFWEYLGMVGVRQDAVMIRHTTVLPVLGIWGCHNQIPYTEWLKPHTLTSHSLGGWEVQDQCNGWFSSWWQLSSWLIDGPLTIHTWQIYPFLLPLSLSPSARTPPKIY